LFRVNFYSAPQIKGGTLPTDGVSVKEELRPALPQIGEKWADFVVWEISTTDEHG
jgi:hypothetical protein